MHFGRWAAAGFLCGLGLAACKSSGLNDEHCENNEGDATCASLYPDGSRPYCGRGSCFLEAEDGCLADRPADDACASPCGGQMYADDPDGRLCLDGGTATGDDDGGMTTGPTGGGPGTVGPDTDTDPSGMTEGATDGSGTATDDGPMGCSGDDDCTDADAPFCVDTLCAPCTATADPDAACAEKFPETPACVASTCVQCSAEVTDACTGNTPLCDTETNTCVGCTAHDQCPDSACHIPYPDPGRATADDGACFDPASVVHVDGDGGQDFMTIGEAFASFANIGDQGVIIVHAAGSYDEVVSLDGNRVLAVLAADGENPQWVQTVAGGGSQLTLTGTSTTVFLDRMRLSGSQDEGSAAVQLNGGRVHIQRSAIVGNDGGGIHSQSSALVHLENAFIGGDISDISAIVVNGSTANLVYSTVGAGFGASSALSCDATASVTIRNSLLVARSGDPELQCDSAVTTYSAGEALAGATNTSLAAMNTNWFNSFGGGDFSLTTMAPPAIATTAQWQTGDPLVDINGNARPGTDGTMDYAGADVP